MSNITKDMNKETLKSKVRGIIVARNTIERMGKNNHRKNPYSNEYLNELASVVLKNAKKVHPLLPYYLSIRAI